MTLNHWLKQCATIKTNNGEVPTIKQVKEFQKKHPTPRRTSYAKKVISHLHAIVEQSLEAVHMLRF